MSEAEIKSKKQVSHDDVVYAAAFFDAEGHAGVHRRKSRSADHPERWQYSAVATISSSDHPILVWFQERWGGHVSAGLMPVNPDLFTVRPYGREKMLFAATARIWAVSHRELAPFLLAIRPHLKLKRPQVDNALALTKVMGSKAELGYHYVGTAEERYAEQTRLFDRHRQIMALAKKRRGTIKKLPTADNVALKAMNRLGNLATMIEFAQATLLEPAGENATRYGDQGGQQ